MEMALGCIENDLLAPSELPLIRPFGPPSPRKWRGEGNDRRRRLFPFSPFSRGEGARPSISTQEADEGQRRGPKIMARRSSLWNRTIS
jgi:hypothetical protein